MPTLHPSARDLGPASPPLRADGPRLGHRTGRRRADRDHGPAPELRRASRPVPVLRRAGAARGTPARSDGTAAAVAVWPVDSGSLHGRPAGAPRREARPAIGGARWGVADEN